jgi:ubiquinone/menaquinone biosynthesis C-methylase UbiE
MTSLDPTPTDADLGLDPERYHLEPLWAYVRGAQGPDATPASARAAGLRIHRFKRTHLARVERVLGLLRGLWPSQLLDVGSGRGAFLWPLLEAFPELRVTSLERSELRAQQLAHVRRGGLERFSVLGASVCAAPLGDDSCEGVTALEVLEHLVDPQAAARELVRVARRFVIASVPSKPDDNPEHLRLFSVSDLEDLFREAGATRVQIQHVLNHRIALVTP